MATPTISVVLLLALSIVAGQARDAPTFNESYFVKGTLYIPSAEVAEPFENWFDGVNNKSRVDYYNGAVKTFQLPLHEGHGVSFKIVPPSGANNDESCWKIDGSTFSPVKLQGMLPKLTGFSFLGGDLIDGVSTERWELVKKPPGTRSVSRYTMWVRKETVPETGKTVYYPVRYDIKGINTLMDNAHFDHYYFDYSVYSSEDVDEGKFNLPINAATCKDIDSKDIVRKVDMNPMMEFMDGEDRHVVKTFKKFKQEHGKEYKTVKENTMRLDLFRMNLRFIQSRSRANLTYRMAVNHLADLSPAELKSMRGHLPMNGTDLLVNRDEGMDEAFPMDQGTLPKSYNWIFRGAVTPVKDQATCGSCYAFASAGAVEGAYFVKCKHLLRLSEQSLVDCTWDAANRGCSGGRVEDDYKWIMNNGIPLDGEYGPYLNEDGTCHIQDIASTDRVRIGRYRKVNRPSEDAKVIEAIKRSLMEKGPMSVLINTKDRAFNFYTGGLYSECTCIDPPQECVRKLDHSVLLVGFGEMDNTPYWLIKNSWSDKWGLNGFVMMPQALPKDCGINFYPTFVEVEECM